MSKMKIVPLQLKINNFYGKIHELGINTKLISIENNENELFKKSREIINKITELIGTNSAIDFTRNNADHDESIMADVNSNTWPIKCYSRGEIVIVLHSVIDDCLETFLVQAKIHKCVQINLLIISISIQ